MNGNFFCIEPMAARGARHSHRRVMPRVFLILVSPLHFGDCIGSPPYECPDTSGVGASATNHISALVFEVAPRTFLLSERLSACSRALQDHGGVIRAEIRSRNALRAWGLFS
ncbi:hypothetical protein X941_5546 [Burkholderia pseudomallei MSHR5569]|nr:hypothetical protein X941_5546 [Burkholderia pseudomallei MSHR5569]